MSKFNRNLAVLFVLTLVVVSLLLICNKSIISAKTIDASKNVQQSLTEPKTWYKYDPEISVLQGTLQKKQTYGPPNFGENPETDQKIEYYVIKLKNPINVKGNKNDINCDTYKNVKQVQLVFTKKINIKSKLNKDVQVTGTLFQAVSGHHFTDVLINVIDIK